VTEEKQRDGRTERLNAYEDSHIAAASGCWAGDGAIAPGYFGQVLGKADLPRLAKPWRAA